MDNIIKNVYENGQGTITFSEAITAIGENAFSDCGNLASITIPETLTTIGKQAFSGCNSLASITLPGGITTIGDQAFSGCNNLARVYCPPTTPPTLGSSVFPRSATIFVPSASVNAYKSANEWSSYAEKIVGYDFNGCTIYYTTSDGNTISPKMDNIMKNVYENGQGMITFSGSITTIESNAFSGCSSLTSITLPEGVTTIGDQAFYSILNSNLKIVYCKPTTPPTLGSSVFPRSVTIFVPSASVNAYKSANEWSSYAEKIVGHDF